MSAAINSVVLPASVDAGSTFLISVSVTFSALTFNETESTPWNTLEGNTWTEVDKT